ncbi:Hypothetical protein FKW44_004447 [Caligus rogercresseyi]|uniref:Uncharacterized protein n=1 Tax=Caligus rogercresseyi TaxID=217165 RepID=A0A7T8HLU4_CALRO|nr:Hypothetical protein FKW44_004447 [Caligus rogercresseyi]
MKILSKTLLTMGSIASLFVKIFPKTCFRDIRPILLNLRFFGPRPPKFRNSELKLISIYSTSPDASNEPSMGSIASLFVKIFPKTCFRDIRPILLNGGPRPPPKKFYLKLVSVYSMTSYTSNEPSMAKIGSRVQKLQANVRLTPVLSPL